MNVQFPILTHHLFKLNLISLCLIYSGTVLSQPLSLEEIRVEETSANKYDQSQLKAYVSAGSYSYLGQSDIQTFRGNSVGDFLSGIPSVIAGNKRNSGALSINIRGLANENRVPIWVDNGLQSVPSWQGYAGSSTRTYLDPDLISQVEIEKGPSFAADSVGAIGGSVRMKTLGWKDIIPEGKDWGVLLKLGTMTNTVSPPAYYTRGGYQTRFIHRCDTNESQLCKEQTHAPEARYSTHTPKFNSYNVSLAFAKKWENADFVFAYSQRKQGNYFVGKHGQTPEIDHIEYESDEEVEVTDSPNYADQINEEITIGKVTFKNNRTTLYRAGEEALNTSQKNQSYLAKFNLYNDHHRLSLAYRHYHSNFGEIMPSILNFRAYGALQGEGTEVKVDSYSLGYQYKPDNPYINLNVNAYYTHSDTSNFTPFIEEYGYSMSSRHAYFLISKQKGVSIDNTSIFTLNNQPLTLKYGIAHNYERIYQPRDAQKRVMAKNYPENAIGPLGVRDGKRKEITAFIAANYPITPKWKLDLGLRYLNTKLYDNIVRKENVLISSFPKDVYKEVIHQQKPFSTKGFSPMAMITFEPIPEVQLYTKIAKTLRSPSLFQVTKGWGMQSTNDALETLKPEQARNIEIGANLLFENLGGKENVLGFKLAYFDNFIKDYLTRTNNGLTGESNKYQTVNIQSARFKGFEASGYFDMRRIYTKLAATYYRSMGFCLTPQQAGKGAQCGSDVDRSNLNNAVPPRLNLHITLGSRWLNEKLDIGARYSYYSKRFLPVLSESRFTNTASIEWKPYSLVDLYASYQVNQNLKLSMTMDNLFNRYYLDANNMGLNTAPGRTLHLGLEYKF